MTEKELVPNLSGATLRTLDLYDVVHPAFAANQRDGKPALALPRNCSNADQTSLLLFTSIYMGFKVMRLNEFSWEVSADSNFFNCSHKVEVDFSYM